MRSISEFFSRIQNKHSQELFVRKLAQEAIQKVSRVTLPIESVSFKSTSIIIKGLNQAEKSEIFLKKNSILNEIRNSGMNRKIEEIRF